VRARIATKAAPREAFFARLNNATKEIADEREIERYAAARWGASSTADP
jgi:hypothetical protein